MNSMAYFLGNFLIVEQVCSQLLRGTPQDDRGRGLPPEAAAGERHDRAATALGHRGPGSVRRYRQSVLQR